MKKVWAVFLCIFLFCSSSSALGADRFIPLGNGPEGQIYIDLATIFLENSIYRCWNKIVYSVEYRNIHNPILSYSMAQYEIDPTRHIYRIVQYSNYAIDGSVLNQASSLEWMPIYPQSIIENMLNFLLLLTQEHPEAINKISPPLTLTPPTKPKSVNGFIYAGIDTDRNEWYVNSTSISYNPQTGIVKALIKIVLDKVSGKKIRTKRFKNISRLISNTSYILQNHYFNLAQNTSALINSSMYSHNNTLLESVDGPCTWELIDPGSMLATIQRVILNNVFSSY